MLDQAGLTAMLCAAPAPGLSPWPVLVWTWELGWQLAQVTEAGDSELPGTIVGLLAGFGLIALVTLIVLSRLSRGLRVLRQGANRFARGDLTQPVVVDGPLQIASVAESLNAMAQQLDERLRTVLEQRNMFGAVLASMTEGVIAFDLDQRLLNLNKAAATLLAVDANVAIGRSIQEVVRNASMLDFVAELFENEKPIEAMLTFSRPRFGQRGARLEDQYIQAQGTVLSDAGGERIGGLVVLHDVTHLRRLEAIRRDFVANVSHELKTPISTIKAAAETLQETLVESEAGDPNFVAIICRQADRLHAIVEDLLTLARLEQEGEAQHIDLIRAPVAPVLRNAIETCQGKAAAKNVLMELIAPPDLQARINANLLEQAVVNLIDNAVKYSPEAGVVRVELEHTDTEAQILVTDHGPGIETEHLPRLFERFYRTDKARSRQMGGTGLGLAIVKHVCQVHGGQVTVDSTVGQGSVFCIHLPRGENGTVQQNAAAAPTPL